MLTSTVRSTCVDINPVVVHSSRLEDYPPHVRGDQPQPLRSTTAEGASAPQAWGSAHCQTTEKMRRTGCPTDVGIIQSDAGQVHLPDRPLHISEGVLMISRSSPWKDTYSPHT